MKLKCKDGIVRDFCIAGINEILKWEEATCSHCGAGFGVHDTAILKPKFREHSCAEAREAEKGIYEEADELV